MHLCPKVEFFLLVPVTQILNDDESFFARFGEASPEAKASKNLHNFFNYIAVKIVHSFRFFLPILFAIIFLFINYGSSYMVYLTFIIHTNY